jgi:CHAT domain-containing protein
MGCQEPGHLRPPDAPAAAGTNSVLAGTGRDGLLFALEAEGPNFDGVELAVLSACDTAQGDVDYSEGVFGLARACVPRRP